TTEFTEQSLKKNLTQLHYSTLITNQLHSN
ncbi:unnamed protein product, partial [Callosobruchus maculatus]